MIQKTGRKTEIEETIVICDFCKANTTARMLDDHDCIEHSGQVSALFGYYSHRDGQKFSFDMCSNCATEVEKILREKWPNLPSTTNEFD